MFERRVDYGFSKNVLWTVDSGGKHTLNHQYLDNPWEHKLARNQRNAALPDGETDFPMIAWIGFALLVVVLWAWATWPWATGILTGYGLLIAAITLYRNHCGKQLVEMGYTYYNHVYGRGCVLMQVAPPTNAMYFRLIDDYLSEMACVDASDVSAITFRANAMLKTYRDQQHMMLCANVISEYHHWFQLGQAAIRKGRV